MTTPENSGQELVPRSEQLPELAHHDIEPAWQSPSTALRAHVTGAYLGRVGNGRFKDQHEEPVPEAGLTFVVSQSSFGGTYLSAKPIEGHTVEALNPDSSSRHTMWVGAPEHSDTVSVGSDWGKLASLEVGSGQGSLNYGNPGVRSGIVRVTDEQGTQRHFLIGADFRGQPDSWRVDGILQEIYPNERLQLMMTPRQLSGNVIDPSLISKELEPAASIGSQHVDALTTAFEHATPDIWILHAEGNSAQSSKDFSEAALDLLIDIAQKRPEILDGTEWAIDKLGDRARQLRWNDQERGYLQRLGSDEENRINYLQAVREQLGRRYVTSENAHSFVGFGRQALDILKTGFENGVTFNLSDTSPVATRLKELITADLRKTAEARDRRVKTLHDSILDPEWKREGISYGVSIPGQKIELDLNELSPLLADEQTYQAYYRRGNTDAQSGRIEGYLQPTLAMIDIDGARYALVDTRDSRGFSGTGRTSKTGNHYSKGERDSGQFKLLRIDTAAEDPRYGSEVTEHNLNFGDTYSKDIQVIGEPRQAKEGTYIAQQDTDVTLEFDEEANKLTILSHYRKAGVLAASDGLHVKSWEQGDDASLQQRLKVREWQKAVRSVERDSAMLRTRLEEQLQAQIDSGWLQEPEDIERHRADIESQVAHGPIRSSTYNGYRGDKWHRSQHYNVSVDADGNIWGDFEYKKPDYNVTGQPVAPGKYIIHENPTL